MDNDKTILERCHSVRAPELDAYLEAAILARRCMGNGRATADLEAVELIAAAASILEHPHPEYSPDLARKLRWCVNYLLFIAEDRMEWIRRVHELDGTYDRIDAEVAAEEAAND